MTGTVHLVGAGPGDPGLITVKGRDLLESADVVIYDALIGLDLLKLCKEGAELIDAGKRGKNHRLEQWEINRLLITKAEEGRNVVRLKGGDPFLFGRGAEEAEELRRAGIEVHVVPGVSSPIAVPELAGIPITHRDYTSTVTFVTGHERQDSVKGRVDWKALAEGHGTIVVLMGFSNAGKISEHLIEGGMDPETGVAIITDGSTQSQHTEITTISGLAGTISSKKLKPPGIMVIGDAVGLRSILGDLA